MKKENSTNPINKKILDDYCKANKTLSMISGRWKLQILFALTDCIERNYSDFKILLPTITDRILTKQLNELLQDGLITKEKNKLTSIYYLSAKGKKLNNILNDMNAL